MSNFKEEIEIITDRKEIEIVLEELSYDKLSEDEKAIVQKEQDDYAKRESELLTAKQDGEMKAKRESAISFLKMGLTLEQVSKGTGLTLEEVQKLSKEKP